MGTHVIVLPLLVSRGCYGELELRFDAGFNVYRALYVYGTKQLRLMRESKQWKQARLMPKSTKEEKKVRNVALEAACVRFGVTEKAFTAFARECRNESGWIKDHLDAAVTEELATRAWGMFATHLFKHTKHPKPPRRGDFNTLIGVPRNAKNGAWQSLTLRGQYHPGQPGGIHEHLGGLGTYRGDLTLVWNANGKKSSRLCIPVKTHKSSPPSSHARLREERALGAGMEQYWRGVKLVRTQELFKGKPRYRYAIHLTVELPAWFPPGRYQSATETSGVGFDTGPGKIAFVTVAEDQGITDAGFLRPPGEEAEHRKDTAKQIRRAKRALKRSRRNTNPDSYGRGKPKKGHKAGKKAKGSRKPGTKLTYSKNYAKKSRHLADLQAAQAEEKKRKADHTAITLTQNHGTIAYTEKVNYTSWAKQWGKGIHDFSPSTIMEAVRRETTRAGGSLKEYPTWSTALSQHCVCGKKIKKPLHQRTHTCDCQWIDGQVLDRDLFSAFLHHAVTLDHLNPDTGEEVYVFSSLLAQTLWEKSSRPGERLVRVELNNQQQSTRKQTPTNPKKSRKEFLGGLGDRVTLVGPDTLATTEQHGVFGPGLNHGNDVTGNKTTNSNIVDLRGPHADPDTNPNSPPSNSEPRKHP